jgi:hypothetical protein
MSLKNKVISSIAFILILFIYSGCGIYSFSGVSTAATNIQVDPFFNNTDLAPANFGQTVTNRVKDYYQRNSSLKVVASNGQLQIDGTVSGYALTQIAPVVDASGVSTAAQSRLTITIIANYVDSLEPKNSFKSKSFSFYADFSNDQQLTGSLQEDLEKKILDQILIDIFNATIANW